MATMNGMANRQYLVTQTQVAKTIRRRLFRICQIFGPKSIDLLLELRPLNLVVVASGFSMRVRADFCCILEQA